MRLERGSVKKEEIIARIAQLARVCTPEWKFDPKHPDAAAALALLFADMFAGTCEQYRKIPQKLRSLFFERMGISMHPCVPAEGFVTFSLSGREFGGAMVPKKTTVLGGSKIYETTEDLYVTPAQLTQIFLCDGGADYIGKKDGNQPFAPFAADEENLQEHALYLCCDDTVFVTQNARIQLELIPFRKSWQNEISQADDWLSKETLSVAGTAAGEDGDNEDETLPELFEVCLAENNRIVLAPNPNGRLPAKKKLFGKEGYWLCFRYNKPWTREPFLAGDIRIAAEHDGLKPDWIQNEMGEQQEDAFFLFGECPALFCECYFASNEALSKAGARVVLTFRLDYEKIPFDNSIPVDRKWKILMKRADFEPDPEYDITVAKVVWEYYNGSGFSRLPVCAEAALLFQGKNAKEHASAQISFLCPADAALLEWQNAPSRYIRVRVLQIKNQFQVKGSYLAPKISQIRFHYHYESGGRRPESAVAVNGLRQRQFTVRPAQEKGYPIFWGLSDLNRRLYLGFDKPLTCGPIRLLCVTEETAGEDNVRVSYEYGGQKGFTPLRVYDGTENLRETGCLTFWGKNDFQKQTLFGKEAYWIRATALHSEYQSGKPAGDRTRIQGMYFNSVAIKAQETMPPEYFKIEPEEKNKICRLPRGNISSLSVWVNELSSISMDACEKFREQGRLKESRDERGQLSGIWILWQQVKDFVWSKETDRHYKADFISGIVCFSDGKNGAVPASGTGATICIRYCCCTGADGNCAPGEIGSLGCSLGFVNGVNNALPVCGGYDQETMQEAYRRAASAMRHMQRAVTARDYEMLAREASRFVHKVKCFSGFDPNGAENAGCVTLVVLSREFSESGLYVRNVQRQIRAYLSSRMDGNLSDLSRLFVIEPQFVRLDCFVRVTVFERNDVFEVQKNVEERLWQFLHPVTGNFDGNGWEIGILPDEMQIANALRSLLGIRLVREVRLKKIVKQKQGAGRQSPCSGSCLRYAVALCGERTVLAETE